MARRPSIDCGVPNHCPVCRAPAPRGFMHVDARDYWRCECCQASFLDPRQLPAAEAEHEHYLTHENTTDDPGYRGFLAKLATPLLERLGSGQSGLDFGCGPGPALAAMFREAGHAVALYDPCFQPDRTVLSKSYDFITCTEVVEHLHRPADVFDQLGTQLRPGGWLGVMTCFQTDDDRFATWNYRRDPTHVVFYREATMRAVAAARGWSCEIPVKDVALMQKPVRREAV